MRARAFGSVSEGEVRSHRLMATWDIPTGSGDRWASDYERGRPGWPVEAVHVAGLPPTAIVLDLGAGTGKLTRLLALEFRRVVAVEPAAQMRQLLVANCPSVEALAGTGQAIPLSDVSVDAVYVAQAFHWFDEVRAVAEITRVLRPGGALVLMWNRPAGPWQPATDAAEAVLTERMPHDVDHFRSTSAARGHRVAGAPPLQVPSSRSRRPSSRIRRRWTATASSPSTPRWAGWQTSPTKSGCRYSIRCARASSPSNTGDRGRRTCTGRALAPVRAEVPLGCAHSTSPG